MKKMLLATALLASAAPANAEWISGNELREWCEASELYKKAQCTAYIMGALDGMPKIETPKDSTRGQVTAVIRKYLVENPETWNLPAAFIIILAVSKAWPTYQKSDGTAK